MEHIGTFRDWREASKYIKDKYRFTALVFTLRSAVEHRNAMRKRGIGHLFYMNEKSGNLYKVFVK